MSFNVGQIIHLVEQLGGDRQQAAEQFQGMQEVDPQQHGGLLSQFGIDPQQLASGGYQQHLDAQQGGYGDQGGGFGDQQQGGEFDEQRGGYGDQDGGFGDQQQGGYDNRR